MTTTSAVWRTLWLLLAILLLAVVAALFGGAAQAQTGGLMEGEDGEGSPGFPYEVADQTWTRHKQITPLQLPASGCTGSVSYEVRSERLHVQIASPPAGIKFNEATRTLSGVPTALLGPQTVFYIATGADGHSCGYMEIIATITEGEGLAFASVVKAQKWTLGERISLELPRAHGGSGAIKYSVIRRASGAVFEWGASGPLPAITFDEDAHRLRGVAIGPVGDGYSIELRATDANGAIGRMSFTVELVEPQQAVEPDAARRIAKAYAPVLLRDRNEKFKPVAINAMLEQSALMQDGSDSPLRSVGDILQVDLLRYNGRDMHLDLFHGRSGTNEREWAKVQGRYPATVYARVFLQDGQHLIVQYWLFYVYNNGPGGGVGVPFGQYDDHEGDWEGIQLVFPSGASHPLLTGETMTTLLRPTWLGYASHNHGDMYLSGEVRWRAHNGLASRPVVYVAEGSHASYAYRVASRAGLRDCLRHYCDIARGGHPTDLVEGETYRLEMINGDEWWLAWTGRWGRDHIHGPMVQGRRWLTPICWPGWRVVSERYKATFNMLRNC